MPSLMRSSLFVNTLASAHLRVCERLQAWERVQLLQNLPQNQRPVPRPSLFTAPSQLECVSACGNDALKSTV